MFTKKILAIFVLCIIILCCSGCITYALSSNAVNGAVSSVGPSITQPEAGWHPYADAAYVDKPIRGNFLSSEIMYGGNLSAGLNYHKALETDNTAYPFIGSVFSASLWRYKPLLSEKQTIVLEELGIPLKDRYQDYSFELAVKPGLLYKTDPLLLSHYLAVIARYENGQYASFRKTVDRTEYFNNIVDNNFSFGIGAGFDIQGGKAHEFDVGLLCEYYAMINRTQSSPYLFIHNRLSGISSPRGEFYYSSSFKIGPYMDFSGMRAAVYVTDDAVASFHFTYKF